MTDENLTVTVSWARKDHSGKRVTEEYPFKVTSLPKNCSKCNNRRQRGFLTSKDYVGPKLCNCLVKVLDRDAKEDAKPISNNQKKPVNFADSAPII